MGHQTSRNTWRNGKRSLRWFPNPSEFAGGHECGTAIVLGSFVLKQKGHPDQHHDCYDGWEKQRVVRCFLANGTLDEDTDNDDVDGN